MAPTSSIDKVQVETSRFGVLDPSDDQIFAFDGGLLGFPDTRRFLALPVEDADGWLWLQATEDPDLAFLTVSAFQFFPGYDFELDPADAGAIGLESAADADVLALVTVHRDENDAVEGLTANLLGPIVINRATRIGRQVVLAESDYTTREPIVA